MSREAIRPVFIAAFSLALAAIPIAVRLAAPDAPRFARTNAVLRIELPPAVQAERVEFDLSDRYAASDEGSAVEIVKPVEINGVAAGEATVRVDSGSNLAISADELGRLLAGAGRSDLVARLPGGQFVGFEAVRQLGIDVRYEAPSDRILIAW